MANFLSSQSNQKYRNSVKVSQWKMQGDKGEQTVTNCRIFLIQFFSRNNMFKWNANDIHDGHLVHVHHFLGEKFLEEKVQKKPKEKLRINRGKK